MAPLKNPRHENFVQEYVRGKNSGNATAAYTVAYGVSRAARQMGYKILKYVTIQQRIDELQEEMSATHAAATEDAIKRLGITHEWVLRKLKEDIEGAERVKQYAVAVRGLELLGRNIGMFLSTGDTINNVLHIGVQVIDRPPDETYEQWIARRKRELTHKTIEHTNGHAKNGNGQGH